MPITDTHIQYLEWVEQNKITVRNSRYVTVDWNVGYLNINQLVALHSETMGLTHIVSSGDGVLVALTPRGAALLSDEREAWA